MPIPFLEKQLGTMLRNERLNPHLPTDRMPSETLDYFSFFSQERDEHHDA
jgi:hypothetical protein